MWRNFTFRLESVFAKHFESEVYTKGISECLQQIRELNISEDKHSPDHDSSNPQLSTFMRQLSRNQLLAFRSPQTIPLNSAQFIALLKCQRNLRSLNVRLDFCDITTKKQATKVIAKVTKLNPTLHLIKSLRIYVGSLPSANKHAQLRRDVQLACSGLLLDSTPMLETLEVWGRKFACVEGTLTTALFRNAARPIYAPKRLKHLTLCHLRLQPAETFLFRSIDLTILHSLQLHSCSAEAPFLRTLAAGIHHSGSQLKIFTLVSNRYERDYAARKTLEAVHSFLTSFTGLEELRLSLWSDDMAGLDQSLEGHRETLKKLHLAHAGMRYDLPGCAKLFESIFARCTSVQQFAYWPLLLSISSFKAREVSELINDEVLATLDAVAAAPTVSILSILYRFTTWASENIHSASPWWEYTIKQTFHRIATAVLRYLHGKGSNVELLALAPRYRSQHSRLNARYLTSATLYFRRQCVQRDDGCVTVEAVSCTTCLDERPDTTTISTFS